MGNEQGDELNKLLIESENIAGYLTRQVNSGGIKTLLDKQNIKRFVEALDAYKKMSGN